MMSKLRVKVAVPFVCSLLLAACSSEASGEPDSSRTNPSTWHETRIDVPPARYGWVTVMEDGSLVLMHDSGAGHGLSDAAALYAPDGTLTKDLSLPDDSNCLATNYLFPQPTSPNAITFLKACSVLMGPGARFQHSLIEYDLAKDSMHTEVAQTGFADQGGSDAVGPFSLRADDQPAVTEVGDVMCSSFAEWDSSGIRFPTFEVEDGSQRWSPSDWSPGSDRSCSRGSGSWPAWAPDGHALAFAVSTDIAGLVGFDRDDSTWAIYTASTDLHPSAALIRGIVEPRTLTWSPDSRQTAFSGTIEGRPGGTWVLDPSTKDLQEVSASRADWLAWTPDGALIGIFQSSSLTAPSSVVLLSPS
jgi:hypothetical protein